MPFIKSSVSILLEQSRVALGHDKQSKVKRRGLKPLSPAELRKSINYHHINQQRLVDYDSGLLSRDTPMTPYTRPPVSTDSATRDRLRDCRNLRQSTAICYILPCPAIFCLPVFTAISAISATSVTSAKFCQVY